MVRDPQPSSTRNHFPWLRMCARIRVALSGRPTFLEPSPCCHHPAAALLGLTEEGSWLAWHAPSALPPEGGVGCLATAPSRSPARGHSRRILVRPHRQPLSGRATVSSAPLRLQAVRRSILGLEGVRPGPRRPRLRVANPGSACPPWRARPNPCTTCPPNATTSRPQAGTNAHAAASAAPPPPPPLPPANRFRRKNRA